MGDRAPHGRTHCCPQGRWSLLSPSSARSTGCATPSHGPVNRIHPEVRAPGPLTATLTAVSPGRPPTALIDPSGTRTVCGRQPCPPVRPRFISDPVHGDHALPEAGPPSRGTKDQRVGAQPRPHFRGLSESSKTKDSIICTEIPEDRAGSVLHPGPLLP